MNNHRLTRLIRSGNMSSKALPLPISRHFDDVFSLARQYPQIYASVGVHPCELKGKDPNVAELLALAEDDNIIAIGDAPIGSPCSHQKPINLLCLNDNVNQ
jgi:Tat protein secretion system quality control protein TatD with DNase activity